MTIAINHCLVMLRRCLTQLSRLSIAIGYNKTTSVYSKNNRLRAAVIGSSNGMTIGLEFDDTGLWQSIEISGLGPPDWITLSIHSVYRDSKYRDMAISEWRLQ